MRNAHLRGRVVSSMAYVLRRAARIRLAASASLRRAGEQEVPRARSLRAMCTRRGALHGVPFSCKAGRTG